MTPAASEALRVTESPGPDAAGEPSWRPALRVSLALGISLLASLLWWIHTPRTLQAPVDIVGYPAFNNWDYVPSFTAYRLTVYAFPIGAIIVYLLLAWRGPLRAPRATLPHARHQAATVATEVDDQPRNGVGTFVSAAARLLLPAGVVALEASTRGYGTRVNGNGAAAAVLYIAAVLVVARVAATRSGGPGGQRVGRGSVDRLVSGGRHVAAANAVLAPAAVLLGLWYVSRHTGVRVGHHVQRWPWLPIWLAFLGAVVVIVWAGLRLRRGDDPIGLERLTISVVVGSVFVFLATSTLPGSLPRFIGGFDDSQIVTGATLLRAGLFPWRDLLFIHGLYPDVLAGNLGLSIFGDTRWGEAAGAAALLVPTSWVVVYLFIVWVSRRNGWFLATAAIVVAVGWLDTIETRFLLAPAVLLVLAGTLARNSARWCVALMTMLFALEILVPETLFLALPTAAVVVAADFVDRDPAARLRAAFRRSYWLFGTGAVVGVLWAVYLIANGALGAFVNYYLIFGPGHNASGAHGPASDIGSRSWSEFALVIGLVVLTYARMAVHARRRTAWTPRHWVTIAAAGFAALYGEKALGRFDAPHVAQTFTAALPLLFLWAEAVVSGLDRFVRSSMRRIAQRHRWRPHAIRHPVAIAGLAVAALVVPVLIPSHSIVTRVDQIPANEHAVIGQLSPVAHIGYAQPRAVDAALLDDLRALLDTYAGRTGRIFDMSNSPGYFYYLLGRLPATKFIHVSMAIPVGAQNILIDELKASRPSVVIFDTTTIGVPHWDRIANDIRHYEVSRYVLKGWTPFVRVGGVLLMLRKDLVAARPPLPPLHNPPVTSHLYDSGRPCDWGDVPNFLPAQPTGASLTVPVRALGERTVATVRGWAADPSTRTSARSVVLVRDGQVVGSGVPFRVRRDVAKALGYGGTSGFGITSLDAGSGPLAVLALTSDGRLHPLRNEPAGALIPRSVRLPDGMRVRVARPTRGRVAETIRTRSAVGLATLPAGTDIRDYDVVTFRAPRALGRSRISLADAAMLDPAGQIWADALPTAGSSLSVRASSCLQWPGFTDQHLYVQQTGGTPATQLELSGVR